MFGCSNATSEWCVAHNVAHALSTGRGGAPEEAKLQQQVQALVAVVQVQTDVTSLLLTA